ncbi:MAG TPA: hypothetical protein VMH00_12260 [Candidatus Limnocylindrales bacterium]|nr:hypothetical protein [Candidatus Limnocylindrales bacterium]
MRRALALLLIALLLAPDLSARDKHTWNNVEKLKPGSLVLVSLWDGRDYRGTVESVADSSLRIYVPDRSEPQIIWQRTFDRSAVRRIAKIRQPDLPNPSKWMAAGTLTGIVVGGTAGAISDVRNGNQGRWFLGGLAGAGLGFFASCAVLAAAGTIGVARSVPHHKIIYESPGPPAPSAPPTS